jgi:hypothetical protein
VILIGETASGGRAVVKMVKILRIPYQAETFVASWAITSFSRSSELNRISQLLKYAISLTRIQACSTASGDEDTGWPTYIRTYGWFLKIQHITMRETPFSLLVGITQLSRSRGNNSLWIHPSRLHSDSSPYFLLFSIFIQYYTDPIARYTPTSTLLENSWDSPLKSIICTRWYQL